jgi:hypothetical protein
MEIRDKIQKEREREKERKRERKRERKKERMYFSQTKRNKLVYVKMDLKRERETEKDRENLTSILIVKVLDFPKKF